MKAVILIIFLALATLFSQSAAITRQDVIAAAILEAHRSYSSADTGTQEIINNVYHPNYLKGGCSGHCIERIYQEWNYPQSYSWHGAPYCYGGNSMGDDCQTKIIQGYGVGADICNYYANGNITSSWAAGLDCSHFACQCLGIDYCTSSQLPNQCYEIGWDALQPGDLLIKQGHVMIFLQWNDSYQNAYTVIHASHDGNPRSGRVWIDETRIKTVDENYYTPYTPKCISGDPAASLAGFKVENNNGIPLLIWETECERDTRAFWVERSFSSDGPWEKITESIPQKGSNITGAEYRVVDQTYPGGRVFYRLMEQETGWRVIAKRQVEFE